MDKDRIMEIGARATFDDYWKRHGDEPGAESVWLQVKHIHIGNMRAALAAFEEAGLVVVPVEPTDTMAHSGAVATIEGERIEEPGTYTASSKITTHEATRVYRAMIRAAKADPQ